MYCIAAAIMLMGEIERELGPEFVDDFILCACLCVFQMNILLVALLIIIICVNYRLILCVKIF